MIIESRPCYVVIGVKPSKAIIALLSLIITMAGESARGSVLSLALEISWTPLANGGSGRCYEGLRPMVIGIRGGLTQARVQHLDTRTLGK